MGCTVLYHTVLYSVLLLVLLFLLFLFVVMRPNPANVTATVLPFKLVDRQRDQFTCTQTRPSCRLLRVPAPDEEESRQGRQRRRLVGRCERPCGVHGVAWRAGARHQWGSSCPVLPCPGLLCRPRRSDRLRSRWGNLVSQLASQPAKPVAQRHTAIGL